VADVGHPGWRENALASAVEIDQVFGELGKRFIEEASVDRFGHFMMPGFVRVNAVAGEGEPGILLTLGLLEIVDGSVEIDNRFDPVGLFDNPGGIRAEDIAVIVFVDGRP